MKKNIIKQQENELRRADIEPLSSSIINITEAEQKIFDTEQRMRITEDMY